MPAKPSNISSQKDLLPTLNQNIREIHIRIDKALQQIPVHVPLKASSTLNFGLIAAQTAVERTLNLPGASTKGIAHVSPALTLGTTAGHKALIWSAYVSQQNQVTIRLMNPTGAGVTPNSVVWNATCIQ